MNTTESMIQRMDQIEKLIDEGVRTVERIALAMHLSQSSVRRYLDIMAEDGEIHVGDWEGEGREAKAMYFLGKSNKVVPPRRKPGPMKKAAQAKESAPVVRDTMLAFLFGEYRRAA